MRFLNTILAIAFVVFGFSSAAFAQCTSPAKALGSKEYFTSDNTYRYCDGTAWYTVQSAPYTMESGSSFFGSSVTIGSRHSCAIRLDNTPLCWGNNDTCAMGTNADLNCYLHSQFFPTPVLTIGASSMISAGDAHTCAIKQSTSEAYCWGSDSHGQMGNGAGPSATTPDLVSGGSTWKKISVGYRQTCGIRSDDSLQCWGHGLLGVLGDNDTNDHTVTAPLTVNGGGSWSHVSTGTFHTCGIKTDNTAWCWGNYNTGQVGHGATGGSTGVPTAVSGGATWKAITAGSSHSCGIKSDDTAWCWGDASVGRLGNGSTTPNQPNPVAVSGGGTWKAIHTNSDFTCGIKSDDTAWCWGSGGFLGNGTTASSSVPVAVSGGGTWKAITGGTNHACGVKTNDSVWCWGENYDVGLANDTVFESLVPVRVQTGDHIYALGGGGGGGGSGGGAGGLAESNRTVVPGTNLTVVVGGLPTQSYGGEPFGGESFYGSGTGGRSIFGGGGGVAGIDSNGFGGSSIFGGGGGGDPFTGGEIGRSVHGGLGGSPVDSGGIGSGIGDTVTPGFALGGGNGLVTITPSGGGCSASAESYSTPGTYIYTVPANCTSVNIQASGAEGGPEVLYAGGGGSSRVVAPGSSSCTQAARLEYDSLASTFYYCNGTNLRAFSCANAPDTCETQGACTTSGTTQVISGKMSVCNGSVWVVMAPPPCNKPTAFNFTDLTSQARSTVVSSNILQITGITCAAAVSVSGGTSPEYRTCSDAACSSVIQNWGSGAGTIANNNYIQVRHTTSANEGTVTSTTMTVGLRSDTWNSTTCQNAPSFNFTDVTGQAALTQVSSNIVQITGFTCGTTSAISIWGVEEYRTCTDMACATPIQNWTATSGTVSNNNYVQIRTTTSVAPNRVHGGNLNIGGSTDTWSVATGDWKLAFLTAAAVTPTNLALYSGIGDGYDDGYAFCNAQASQNTILVGLTFAPWLSAGNNRDPNTLFNKATVPYKLVNGTNIANNWTDLTDGTLAAAINVNQSGGAGSVDVWSNTTSAGVRVGNTNCSGWSGSSGNGRRGTRTSTTATWADSGQTACTTALHLYCFQQ